MIEKSEGGKKLVFLLRHGEPEFPDSRPYIYGHADYPLSEAGRAEARNAGLALSGVDIGRVLSSDLKRARETADIVCRMQPSPKSIEVDPRLREIDMGEWDGLPKEEIAEKFPDLFMERGKDITAVRAPGGESFGELRERAVGALEDIVAGSGGIGRILVVAHGGLFWTVVSGLFDIPLPQMTSFGLDYCALHLLEHSVSRGWRLIRYNWSPDLTDYMDYPVPELRRKNDI